LLDDKNYLVLWWRVKGLLSCMYYDAMVSILEGRDDALKNIREFERLFTVVRDFPGIWDELFDGVDRYLL